MHRLDRCGQPGWFLLVIDHAPRRRGVTVPVNPRLWRGLGSEEPTLGAPDGSMIVQPLSLAQAFGQLSVQKAIGDRNRSPGDPCRW